MTELRVIPVRQEYVEHFVNTWTLQNVCVAFYRRRNTTYLSQWISRRGVAANIYGFSEYINGYQRVSWVRPELPSDELDDCVSAETGAAFSFPANNIYHAFFHAVPAWRALQNVSSVLIPLVGEHAGQWLRPNVSSVHAWEFMTRALTDISTDALFSNLKLLLSARCTCFRRVVGNTEAFEPRAPMSRPTLQAFCRVALQNSARFVTEAAALLKHSQRFYVSRRGSRYLLNEDALTSIFQEYSVRKIHLEMLSVSDQMHLMSQTRLLVAMHGQALAYMPFLSLGERATVIEFTLPHSASTWRSKLMYEKWAVSLGLSHFPVKTTYAIGCRFRERMALKCPVVIRAKDVSRVMLATANASNPPHAHWCAFHEVRLCK